MPLIVNDKSLVWYLLCKLKLGPDLLTRSLGHLFIRESFGFLSSMLPSAPLNRATLQAARQIVDKKKAWVPKFKGLVRE